MLINKFQSKKKRKNSCNVLIMTFTNLEKKLYSKRYLKQRRQRRHPSLLQQSRRYFRAEKVIWLRLFVHLKRLIPAAQDQEDYFKSAEFLNNCHKLLNIYNWTKLHILVLSHCPWVVPRVVALVPTSTSASITLISLWLVWSRSIRYSNVVLIEIMKKRNRELVLWRILFRQGMGLPLVSRFQCERLWLLMA